jgi:hypothetical protein
MVSILIVSYSNPQNDITVDYESVSKRQWSILMFCAGRVVG